MIAARDRALGVGDRKTGSDGDMRLFFVALGLLLVSSGGAFADAISNCNQENDYDLKIRGCTDILEGRSRPGYPRYAAYANRCYAYNLQNDYERAIKDCSEAIRLKPGHLAGHTNRCFTYLNMGDYELAIADCSEALRIKHDFITAYEHRCLAYSLKGDFDRATADCDNSIRLKPNDANAYNDRAQMRLQSGKLKEAKADADKAVAIDATYASPKATRGLILLALGDAKAAQDDFTEALRLQANNIRALWGRGQAYERQGLRSLALADYKRAVGLKAQAAYLRTEYQEKARARLSALEAPPVAQVAAVAAPSTLPVPAGNSGAFSSLAQAQTGRRVALVIGNSAYKAVSPLPNPVNDAAALGQELSRLGFEVIVRSDLTADGMRKALSEFEDKATGADWALVYYAGHGMELNGKNWLIPIDAQLVRANDAPDETVPLDRVLDRVRAAKRLRIVILDACRNNPFLPRMAMSSATVRAIDRGLTRIEPSHGEVVFYAARDGSVANDGAGGNSPFVTAMVKHMGEDGIELGRFFRKVTSDVLAATNNQQEPFMYGRLPDEDFYFKPPK